jgi:hypothetical protein
MERVMTRLACFVAVVCAGAWPLAGIGGCGSGSSDRGGGAADAATNLDAPSEIIADSAVPTDGPVADSAIVDAGTDVSPAADGGADSDAAFGLPTFVGFNVEQVAASVPMTPPPGVVAGDVVLAAFRCGDTGVAATPAGWTSLDHATAAPVPFSMGYFWIQWPSNPGTYTFSCASASSGFLAVVAYRGANASGITRMLAPVGQNVSQLSAGAAPGGAALGAVIFAADSAAFSCTLAGATLRGEMNDFFVGDLSPLPTDGGAWATLYCPGGGEDISGIAVGL